MSLVWNLDLEIGIPVIDSQHQRIVEYITQVEQAEACDDTSEVIRVLEELVDYTLSHFAFEENLMEEAGYPFVNAHKTVHQLFEKRIAIFQRRAKIGENVTAELLNVLRAWLVNHIKRDDKDYSDIVKANLEAATVRTKAKKGRWFERLFG